MYALRQVVLHRSTSYPKDRTGEENVIREFVEELVVEPSQAASVIVDKQPSATPIADALVRAAGKGTWGEVYTNAEISEMRLRGEVIPPDLVSRLSGSLGPASLDEKEYFTSFDLAWERFSE